MPEIARLQLVVDGNTSGAEMSLRNLEGRTNSFVSRAGATLVGFLTRDLIRGTMAAVAGIFQVGMAYEDAINVFQAASQAGGEQMERVRETARALGRDLTLPKTSAADAAVAMTELTKGGLGVQQSMDAARGALLLAAAANMEEAKSAEIVVNTLNAFNLRGREAAMVADLLAAASVAASGDVGDMAYALQYAAGAAARTGIPIRDVVTSIGMMAQKGIQGSLAGTSFRQMLMRLQAPTKKTTELLNHLNITVYDAQGKFVGMRSLVEQFSNKLGGASQQVRDNTIATIFGARAGNAANFVLLRGVAAYDDMYNAVGRTNAAQQLAEARNKGLRGAIDAVRSVLEEVAIGFTSKVNPSLRDFALDIGKGILVAKDFASAVGRELAPFLRELFGFIGDVAGAFGSLVQAAAPLVGVFLRISGGAVIGLFTGLMAVLGPVARLFRDNEAAATILATALAALAVASVWGTLSAAASNILPRLIGGLQGAAGGALGMIAAFGRTAFIGGVIGGLVWELDRMAEAAKKVQNTGANAVKDIIATYPTAEAKVKALRSMVAGYGGELKDLESKYGQLRKTQAGHYVDMGQWNGLITKNTELAKEANRILGAEKEAREQLGVVTRQLKEEEARAAEERKAALLEMTHMGAEHTAARMDQSGASIEAIRAENEALKEFRKEVSGAYNEATSTVKAFANESAVSASQVLEHMAKQVQSAREWATNMKELAKSGMDEGFLKEVAAAGPKAAPLVEALLEAVRSGNVGVINQAQEDLRLILEDVLGQLTDAKPPAYAGGKGIGQSIDAGIGVTATAVEATGRHVAARGIAGADSQRGRFNTAGRFAGSSFVNGIAEQAGRAWDAGWRIGASAISAARNVIATNPISIGIRFAKSLVGLAKGGIVDKPTFALIGEGGSREVVLPTDDLKRAWDLLQESGLAKALAGDMAGLAGAGGMGGGQPTNAGGGSSISVGDVYIDARGASDPSAVKRAAESGGREFLDDLVMTVRSL